jgi:hypothetical protein
MPDHLAKLHEDGPPRSPALLGPLVCLGSCECPRVAAALSAFCRGELETLVCASQQRIGCAR